MKEKVAAEQTRRIASALERIEVCYGKLQSESSISFSYGKIDDPDIQDPDSTGSELDGAIKGRGSASETEAEELGAAKTRIEELESLLENAASENARLKAELEDLKQTREAVVSSDSDAVAELQSELDSMVEQRAEKVSELDEILSELESLLETDEKNA